MENLAGLKIPDCDAEQIVDVDVDQRLLAVDREGTCLIAERADALDDLVGPAIGNRHGRSAQRRKVNASAVR